VPDFSAGAEASGAWRERLCLDAAPRGVEVKYCRLADEGKDAPEEEAGCGPEEDQPAQAVFLGEGDDGEEGGADGEDDSGAKTGEGQWIMQGESAGGETV